MNISRRKLIGLAVAGAGASACRTHEPTKRTFRMQTPWVNDAEFIGYFVAIQNGLYKEAGLDLVYQPGGPDIIAEGALLSNRADLALTPVETTINLIARDRAPLRIIGTQYQQN